MLLFSALFTTFKSGEKDGGGSGRSLEGDFKISLLDIDLLSDINVSPTGGGGGGSTGREEKGGGGGEVVDISSPSVIGVGRDGGGGGGRE